MTDKKLFVEGELDGNLLNPIMVSGWTVEHSGGVGKYELPQKTKWHNIASPHAKHIYLRDRDFDFEPDPLPDVGPFEMKDKFGYYWKRHEIENYILEPSIVEKATEVNIGDYQNALLESGRKIRYYQAARWAVGLTRIELPRSYDLRTHPTEIDPSKFALPVALDSDSNKDWACKKCQEFGTNIGACLNRTLICEKFDKKTALFSDKSFISIENILIWFSGKDLLAGLKEWLDKNKQGTPKELLNKIRDWMIFHNDQVLEILPEWKRLQDILKT